MKKFHFLFLLLTFSYLLSFGQSTSQKFNFSLGNANDLGTEFFSGSSIKIDSNIYCNIHFHSSEAIIDLVIFDKNLKRKKEKKLKLRHEGKNWQYQEYSVINNELYFFTSTTNSSSSKCYLFVRKLNSRTLILGKKIKILELNFEGISTKDAKFHINESQDKSKILISTISSEKEKNTKLHFNVFDYSFNEIRKQNIELPVTTSKFKILQRLIDNNGNVHFLGRTNTIVGLKPDYFRSYQIISSWNQEKGYISYPLKIENRYLRDIRIQFDNDFNILGGGLFCKFFDGKNTTIGSLFIRINKNTQQLEVQKSQDFELDFFLQHLNDKEQKGLRKKAAKGKNIGFKKYFIDSVFYKKDGGIILTAEQYISKPGEANRRFNDIIVLDLLPDGSINWFKKIRKKHGTNLPFNPFVGYTTFIRNNHLYLLYNDRKGNSKKTEEEAILGYNRQFPPEVVLIEIDPEGNLIKKVISPNPESKLVLLPHQCLRISDQEWLLFMEQKKKTHLARITFP